MGGVPVGERRAKPARQRNEKKLSSPAQETIPLVPSGKSALPARPVLSRQEGRIAIVTNAGGDAVDALASARNGVAGRVSRERYLRAGRTAPKRTAKPCGPDTRCWCHAVGGEIDPTGSEQPSSRQRRGQDEL